MSKSRQSVPVYAEEEGIECSVSEVAKSFGGCIACVMSIAALVALGLIAGGSFWTAYNFAKMTDGKHYINLVQCYTKDEILGVDYQEGIVPCPS